MVWFKTKLWRPHPTEWTKGGEGLRWSNVSTKTTCVDWNGIIEHGSKPGKSVILTDDEVPEFAGLSWLQ